MVKRYSPEVQTQKKIYSLAEITEEDCKFIDELMSKYSYYEHSQPEELPISLPDPGDLEKDLTRIISFIEELNKRNK